jgi:ATP-binding cassette subfamily B protein
MQNAMREIYKTGILMAVLVLIQLVCNYYYDYRGHSMGAMMERDMRNELFAQYQRLSFRFYDGQKVGKLMSRITNDLLLLSELYHHGPEDYIMYFVKFVGAFTILMTINVKLTLAVFVFLPILAVFSLYINKKINAAINRNYDRIGDVNARIEDNLSGIRVVKSFANEEMETRLFACENDRFLESRKGIYWNESVL